MKVGKDQLKNEFSIQNSALPLSIEESSHGDVDFRVSEVIPVRLGLRGYHALAGQEQRLRTLRPEQ